MLQLMPAKAGLQLPIFLFPFWISKSAPKQVEFSKIPPLVSKIPEVVPNKGSIPILLTKFDESQLEANPT